MRENKQAVKSESSNKTSNVSFFKKHAVQPKLQINEPGDSYEHEADRMADKVMRMSDTSLNDTAFFKPSKNVVQRKCHQCEEDEKDLHRKESSTGEVENNGQLDSYVSSLNSTGQPLSTNSKQFFEPRFGRDFSNVRIHTDSVAAKSAQSINALAYTTGNNIVFNHDQYSPETTSGRKLMAHELTHVVQQNNTVKPKLIQRLECNLAPLTTECNNASTSCHKADSYCTSKYAKASDVNDLYDRTTQNAKDKGASYPLASKNLLHYLDNSGTGMNMPSSAFSGDPATADKLKNEHRSKFINGATARINDGRLTPGGTVDMIWTGTANAFTLPPRDMSLAVGGYTLCSKVTVQAIDQGSNSFKIVFNKWTVQGFDCYNWDPGKGIGAAGFDDNDLCCLENNSKAKHYLIQCDPWDNIESESIKDEVVIANAPGPGVVSPVTPTPPTTPAPSTWDKVRQWVGGLL